MNFQQRSNTTPRTPTTPDLFNSNSEYKPRKVNLLEEVSVLMKSFGDSLSSQNRDSIVLVEKIVIQQVKSILNEVMNVAYKRTGNINVTSQCDFEFFMRRHPSKAQRFRKHLKNVLQFKIEQKQGYGMNFLNRMVEENNSDEEPEIYDPERTRRLFRADRISQILNQQKYEEFQKARSWFSNAKNRSEMMRKIIEIFQIPKESQDNTNLEILCYLVQETVATIVDFSILTRLNTDNQVTDPVTISSNITSNMLHLCPEVTQGRGMDGIKPITVQEINEAIRRVQTMSTRRMGTSFRSCEMTIPFLAIWWHHRAILPSRNKIRDYEFRQLTSSPQNRCDGNKMNKIKLYKYKLIAHVEVCRSHDKCNTEKLSIKSSQYLVICKNKTSVVTRYQFTFDDFVRDWTRRFFN